MHLGICSLAITCRIEIDALLQNSVGSLLNQNADKAVI